MLMTSQSSLTAYHLTFFHFQLARSCTSAQAASCLNCTLRKTCRHVNICQVLACTYVQQIKPMFSTDTNHIILITRILQLLNKTDLWRQITPQQMISRQKAKPAKPIPTTIAAKTTEYKNTSLGLLLDTSMWMSGNQKNYWYIQMSFTSTENKFLKYAKRGRS